MIGDLKRKRRSINSRQNLVLFRLATCCGLRVSEIVGLNMSNLKVSSGRPFIEIPARIANGKQPRRVPLWWDGGTLVDLQSWKVERGEQGAGPNDPLVCSQAKGTQGKRLSSRNAQARFRSVSSSLGWSASESFQFTAADTAFAPMPWPGAALSPRSAMRQGMLTYPLLRCICT